MKFGFQRMQPVLLLLRKWHLQKGHDYAKAAGNHGTGLGSHFCPGRRCFSVLPKAVALQLGTLL
ncbi:MAG TPA: hypothetical protein VGZ47_07420, partial [Gemmataceae bacterium]|nr:hypothetical protein [Gemmataceae bacterium]